MRPSRLVVTTAALLCLSVGGAEGQQDVLPPASRGLDFANVGLACVEPITLPEPTGHHQIGVVTYHWIDRSRPNDLTPDSHDDRPLIATVFYPALRAPDGPPAVYVPELDLLREGFRTDRRDPPRDIAAGLAAHGCVLTSAYADRPLDSSRARYPVALVSPGGNVSRHWHTALAQELASQGWVTAVMSHAHSGLDVFPRMGFTMSSERWEAGEEAGPDVTRRLDDELADVLAADASFTLDRLSDLGAAEARGPLAGALDLERVAIIGHSRGGSTVARACSTDERFDACVTYDNIGPDHEREAGLDGPQLVIRASWDADRVRRLHEFLRRNRAVALDVELEGAGHMSFTDLPFIEPDRYEVVPLSSARAHEATAAITLAFLDAHVLGGPGDPARVADGFEAATLARFGGPGGTSSSVRGHASDAGLQPLAMVGLPIGDPAEHGIRPSGIAAARVLADSLGSAAYVLVIDGAVIDAYGNVAGEYRVHSVRKILLGTLYGPALAEGRADTTSTLAELGIDDGDGLMREESAATVADLLASRSGVYLPAVHENPAWDGVRPARGSAEPGEVWFYSNWDFNAAGTAWVLQTRQNPFAAFERRIARPIGMLDFAAEDGAWRYGPRSRHPAYVFRMSARDLARFGVLMANEGVWDGRRVLPASWVREITRRRSQARRPDGELMPGVGYGLMWWTRTPRATRDVYGELGGDSFIASGTGGQLLLVAPESKLVFVHRNDTDVPSHRYRGISTTQAGRILKTLLGG